MRCNDLKIVFCSIKNFTFNLCLFLNVVSFYGFIKAIDKVSISWFTMVMKFSGF